MKGAFDGKSDILFQTLTCSKFETPSGKGTWGYLVLLMYPAVIKNLHVDADIRLDTYCKDAVDFGVIAGVSYSYEEDTYHNLPAAGPAVIENCSVTGSITICVNRGEGHESVSARIIVGGIAGSWINVIDSRNDANIFVESNWSVHASGILGSTGNLSNVEHCYNSGNIIANVTGKNLVAMDDACYGYVSGITTGDYSSNVSNCCNAAQSMILNYSDNTRYQDIYLISCEPENCVYNSQIEIYCNGELFSPKNPVMRKWIFHNWKLGMKTDKVH